MTFVLRETQPVVVHVDTDVIRAGVGIFELIPRSTTVSRFVTKMAANQ